MAYDNLRAMFVNCPPERSPELSNTGGLHVARMLKDAEGIQAYGNQRSEWDAGKRFGMPDPEYR
jgi:hypothetical protein